MTSGSLDGAADGAFSGTLSDPADTLTKRGGKGSVTFEGVEYTRLDWIRRLAQSGGSLAAGEGAILDGALTAQIEAAFREGHECGYWSGQYNVGSDVAWQGSDARWLLTGEEV